MRVVVSAMLVLGTFLLVTLIQSANREILDPVTFEYVAENFAEDTGSKNGVAAVLLNYRMYDTVFEALILLTAIIGMNQFLPRPSDIKHHLDRRHGAARRAESNAREGIDDDA